MSYRILVVDDDPWMSSMLRAFLTGEGFEVVVAGETEAALQKLATSAPDLVIMKLPTRDDDGGWSLAHAVRGHRACVPMIAFAGAITSGEKERVAAFEADGYLRKPIELRSLVNQISRVLQPPVESSSSQRRFA